MIYVCLAPAAVLFLTGWACVYMAGDPPAAYFGFALTILGGIAVPAGLLVWWLLRGGAAFG